MEYYHKDCRGKVEFCKDVDYGTRFYVCRRCNVQIQDEESTTEIVYLKHLHSLHLSCGKLVGRHQTYCETCQNIIQPAEVRMEVCFSPYKELTKDDR